MSGTTSGYTGTSNSFAQLTNGVALGTPLIQMLMADAIEPGSAPSYELCKTIYAYHPLGSKLTDAPITMAQSQPREISVPVLGEDMLVQEFNRVWDSIGQFGATAVIHNVMKTSRIYGIAALAVGEIGRKPETPLDPARIGDADLYFNVLDPLNTAGSLVLDQDPNAPDFLKPGPIAVNGVPYHPSRVCVVLNEKPIYIEWTTSAFGFVGRSVYQRILYPLKTFIQTMATDQMVTQKAGLLIAKMESPGGIIDNLMQSMAFWKRSTLKSGVTGQVMQVGVTEDVQTLNMQNLDAAAKFARDNVLKNIATGANMPASMVNNETLAEGFGEGSEDAKAIAHYIDYVRMEMKLVYDFMDRFVMRKAWTPAFYEALRSRYDSASDSPDGAQGNPYRDKPYDVAFAEWRRAFVPTWPNLLTEPESELAKVDDIRFKAAVAMAEISLPYLDPINKAAVLGWLAEQANERPRLFAGHLDIDEEALAAYTPPAPAEGPREPLAFESET